MKKTLLFLSLLVGIQVFAQTPPQFINYQAIIRDASGIPFPVGSTVTVNFKLFNALNAPGIAYEEDHLVTIPTGSVVALRIGQGNSIAPNNNFSSVIWSAGSVHYVVTVNGNAIGTARSPFASVPYALNAGGSGTTYSPSTNVTTTGNILDLSNTLSNPGSFGSNTNPNSKVPVFSVDQKGRLVSAGEYTANIYGDIAGRLDSQLVIKLKGVPISSVLPTAGQILQFNSGNWTPATLSGSGPWTYNSGTIFPSNNASTDKVAIGSNNSSSLLNVLNSSASTVVASPVANFLNTNSGFSASGVVAISNQSGSGAALYVQNVNSAAGSPGISVNISGGNTSEGILSTHNGNGRAGSFISSNNSSTSEVLFANSISSAPALRAINTSASSNSLAIGVHGKTNNANANAAGVWGENVGSGSGVIGTTSANVAAVIGLNFSTTNINASGVYGLSNSTSTLAAGVYGESKLGGNAVFGINSSAVSTNVNGVYGTVSNAVALNSGVFGEVGGTANGVKGINKGSGNSILGSKPTGATGMAGRFEILDNTNNSAALFAITQGTGAAVQAQAGAPLTSALSVNMVGGHLKSSGNITVLATSITFTAGPSFSVAFAPVCNNCNDVRGEVSFNAQTTTALIPSSFVEAIIPFTKAYGAPPIVVASPTSDLLGLAFLVTGVTANDFRIRLYRPNGQSFPTTIAAATYFNFTYHVIE